MKQGTKAIAFIILLIVICWVAYSSATKSKQTLITRGKITTGTILEVHRNAKIGSILKIQYYINGRFYITEVSKLYLSYDKALGLKNHRTPVPVLYDSIDPNAMDLMITIEDYEMNFPDSIRNIHNL